MPIKTQENILHFTDVHVYAYKLYLIVNCSQRTSPKKIQIELNKKNALKFILRQDEINKHATRNQSLNNRKSFSAPTSGQRF